MSKQPKRLLEMTTASDKNSLVLTHLDGREALSTLFDFSLRVFTKNDSSITNLQGQTASIQLNNHEQTPRYFHGIINKTEKEKVDAAGHQTYRLTLVPWLWFLSLNVDCRIFQNKSVVDIFKTICQEKGFSDFNVSGLTQTYTPLDYCVQYNESDLNFISRLFEQAGIYYYFKFEKNKHTLMLLDTPSQQPQSTQNIAYTNIKHDEAHLHRWTPQKSYYSESTNSTDYNCEAPNTNLFSTAKRSQPLPDTTVSKALNIFHYPGHFQEKSAGQTNEKNHMASLAWQANTIEASGNYAHLQAGLKFQLKEHEDSKQLGDYYIESITHEAGDLTQLHQEVSENTPAQYYKNTLTCVSEKLPYKPIRKTRRPHITGKQTGFIVGPEGQDIYTDKYGRVKVQFHWDRVGKNDEKSSCWLRTMQTLSGDNWGTQFIPRIGQEATITFLSGDPDRPMITGTTYNAENELPFSPPINQAQSGIKTHTLGSDDPDAYNELLFDDTPESEKITFTAQKDLNVQANHDETVNIQNNYNHTVQKNNTSTETSTSQLYAKKELTLKAGSGSITMSPSKIAINGAKVSINP